MAAARARRTDVPAGGGAGGAAGDPLIEGRHSSHARYWLALIVEATEIGMRDRHDINLLRAKVMLARTYAKAALLGREPPPHKELPGQLDLFAEREEAA